MVRKREQCQMKLVLSEAISMLCKASLQYHSEMYIEGLIGITLDNHDIFLVNINESVQKSSTNNCKKFPGQTSPLWQPNTSSEKDCLRLAPDGRNEVGGKRRRISSPHPTADLMEVKQEAEENSSPECENVARNAGPTSGRSTPSSDMSEEARMVIDLSPPAEKQESIPGSPSTVSVEVTTSAASLPLPASSLPQGTVAINPFDDNGADDFGSHLSLSAEASLETALPSSWDPLEGAQGTEQATSGLLTSENIANETARSNPQQDNSADLVKEERASIADEEHSISTESQPENKSTSENVTLTSDNGELSQTHIGGIALPQILNQIIERAKESQRHENQSEYLDTSGDRMRGGVIVKEEVNSVDATAGDVNTSEGVTSAAETSVVPTLPQMVLPTMHPALQTSQLTTPETLFYPATPPNFVNPFMFSRGPGRPSSMQKQTLPFPQGQVMYPPGFINPFPRGHFSPVKGPPFICGVCGKWYTARSNLSSHMLLHKDKVYPCESCGKVFNHPGYLKQHVKYVHDQDKNYECPVCHKRFAKNQNLQIHMRRHLGTLDEASVERMLQMAASAAHAQASGGVGNQGNQVTQSAIVNPTSVGGQIAMQESPQEEAVTPTAVLHSTATSTVTMQSAGMCGSAQSQPGYNVYEAGLIIKSEPQI